MKTNYLTASKVTSAMRVAAMVTTLSSASCYALEFTAGDYDQIPAGMNVGLLYLQRAERSDLYSSGDKVAADFEVDSNVALLRYIHVIQVSERTTFDANLILPAGQIRTSGSASAAGNASGAGDLITGGAFIHLLDPATQDTISIAPFLTIPTGSYDPNHALNIGENRWKLLVQGVYVKHFGSEWALDLGVDATKYWDNSNYGTAGVKLTTDTRVETQAHLRYNLSAATTMSVGVGHINGAEDRVDGVAQSNELSTTYARLTAAHFVTPTTQIQVQLGRDVEVRNGAEEKGRLNLRLMQLF